ncbi:hypothetical protein GWK47_007115 [Chionoecetes opilio]|uniref:Uncharacterized protein n=1 Tax=Chionoecetes opilio TaxID=41210 RepID=A0A8J4Y8X2_CHIOP|nr:hypothetical protein GWK47_007115 [Chionoecetes opilio]
MDKYVKRSDSDRSRNVSGDSSCSSVSYRTSTPAPSASRTHTPQGTSDISLSDVELDSSQLFTQDIEESGTEQEDQRKRQEGTRQLKAMLWHLEKFFVFDSYVRTENDTLEGKSVHTGRARCQQKTCLSKGKAATYTYTTRSKVNLKKHYEKMHSAMLQCVRTAFDGATRGVWPKAGRTIPPKGGPPARLGGAFQPEGMCPQRGWGRLHRHFFTLRGPREFSAPPRGGPWGGKIRPVSATPKGAALFIMLFYTTTPHNGQTRDGQKRGLHWRPCHGSARISAANMAHWGKGKFKVLSVIHAFGSTSERGAGGEPSGVGPFHIYPSARRQNAPLHNWTRVGNPAVMHVDQDIPRISVEFPARHPLNSALSASHSLDRVPLDP